MLKKIVLGFLIVGLSGILVVGAVNRTTDRTTGTEQIYRQGNGNGSTAATSDTGERLQGTEQIYQQGNRNGSTETTSDAGERLRGAQGTGGINRGNTAQGSNNYLEADPIFTQESGFLQGIVVGVEKVALTVESMDGEEIVVKGRAWSFAQEQGFAPSVNDQVELTGDVAGEEFEVWQMENLTNGQIIVLRDGSGSPAWAGRGKMGG